VTRPMLRSLVGVRSLRRGLFGFSRLARARSSAAQTLCEFSDPEGANAQPPTVIAAVALELRASPAASGAGLQR
jgi:hypothetical protein